VELPLEDTELDNRNYDDEKQQVGGFGTPHGKIHIKQQINHDGEVNRARCALGAGPAGGCACGSGSCCA
jgi:histone-binding protein RBBP4